MERIADLGIVNGRLRDVIDRTAGATAAFADEDVAALRAALARFGGQLAELDARVASLEGPDVGETDAVRVAEVERLREALTGVRPTPGPSARGAPNVLPDRTGPKDRLGRQGRRELPARAYGRRPPDLRLPPRRRPRPRLPRGRRRGAARRGRLYPTVAAGIAVRF